MTRSGTEMMNSGEPITGSDRRFLNKAGIDMGNSSTSFLDLCAILRACPRSIRVRADDARSVGRMAIALREKKAGPERRSSGTRNNGAPHYPGDAPLSG
jgi:hypothetical protein